jgi:hypothetical protein
MCKVFIQQRHRRKIGPSSNRQKDDSTKAAGGGDGNANDAAVSIVNPTWRAVEPNDSLLLAAAADAHQFGNLGSFFDNVGDQFVAQQHQQRMGTDTNLILFNQMYNIGYSKTTAAAVHRFTMCGQQRWAWATE